MLFLTEFDFSNFQHLCESKTGGSTVTVSQPFKLPLTLKLMVISGHGCTDIIKCFVFLLVLFSQLFGDAFAKSGDFPPAHLSDYST